MVYVQIPMNSNLNWLKYIDPAYCLNAGDITGKYVNINILGEPVSYPVVVYGSIFPSFDYMYDLRNDWIFKDERRKSKKRVV